MRNILFLISFLFSTMFVFGEGYMFRIELKDKGNPPYTIDNPSAYLSEKALERRQRQGIAIDHTDLPIDPLYLETIKATGATIKATSKWIETVTVYLPDFSAVSALKNLDFVDTLYCVWKEYLPQSDWLQARQNKYVKDELHHFPPKRRMNIYGEGYEQVSMLGLDVVHDAGFRGKGMSIAVLDVGFLDSDRISALNFGQIKEVKNFTHTWEDLLRSSAMHGTAVLSCMLANQQGIMVGTAPEADYYLFKTEVEIEEFPVEEDYWVTAVEYADSIGIDVINTSLGYYEFDDPSMNHSYEQLDGYTILASRAASIAGDKGMLLFNAAGNEGYNTWGKITVPNDADNIISVGAVNSDGVIAAFSSRGPAADGRIKPDLCAMGELAVLIDAEGNVIRGSGTSYASPVLAGAGACLWQALPEKTNKEIIALMKNVGNRYTNPDFAYGYGIPDVGKAYTDNITDISWTFKSKALLVFDATTDHLFLTTAAHEKTDLQIFNSQGQLLLQYADITTSVDVSMLHHGIYIAYVRQGEKQAIQKFIKW